MSIQDPDPNTAAALGDTAVAAPRSRSIRRRLMERVADADTSHVTVDSGDGRWRPFVDGVQIKVLHEAAGTMSYLLKLEPGARLPAHRHPADEECIVIEGSVRVGTQVTVGAGGYHLAHRGALHPTISTDTGATIFLRGAAPGADHVLD